MKGEFIQIKEINKYNCSIYLKGDDSDLYSIVIPKSDLGKLHLNDIIDFNPLPGDKENWAHFPKISKHSGKEPAEALKDPVDISLLDGIDNAVGEEVPEKFFKEGKAKIVYVNKYERSDKARDECIKHWGCKCYVCGVVLSDVYGEIAEGFIHIHHLKELSLIGEEYAVNPVSDLRPLCPNCHAIVHLKVHAMDLDELKTLLERLKSPSA